MFYKSRIERFLSKLAAKGALPNDIVSPFLNVRNPRNLERIRIGYKPSGYFLEKPGRIYWHKLILDKNVKDVRASVVHYTRGVVLQASSSEWSVKKHLYSCTDTAAYMNLGRVLGKRCLMSGIYDLSCFLEVPPGGKVEAFLNSFKETGIALKEPGQYRKPVPGYIFRPEKPWQIQGDN